MTADDDYADLARLAEAFPARERTWHMHEMDRVFVGPGEPGNLDGIVHMSADPLSDLDEKGAGEERRNGAWIAAANPATILRLIAELRRAKRAAQTLGRVIEQQGRDVLDATGMHHVIGEDGDGDWAVVWEVLADQAVERRQMAARLAAVEAALSNHPRTCEVYPRDQHWCGWKRAVADVEAALAAPTDTTKPMPDTPYRTGGDVQ